jgi:hypothetical protein
MSAINGRNIALEEALYTPGRQNEEVGIFLIYF